MLTGASPEPSTTGAVISDTLGIGFDGQQVVVRSSCHEVLAGVAHTFGAMLVSPGPSALGCLSVTRENGSYHLSGECGGGTGVGPLNDILRAVTYHVTLHFIEARPDLLWLHAGAAAWQGRAVLIAAPGGQGKSTLVTRLCGRGWAYLGDDVIPLDPTSGVARAFPQTPAFRKDPARDVAPPDVSGLPKVDVPLDPGSVCRRATPVGTLIRPIFRRHGSTELSPCGPAEAGLALLTSALNFPRHREAAVQAVARLVDRVPAFQLTYARPEVGAELIARAHGGDLQEASASCLARADAARRPPHGGSP
jgi:hypothetical protein